MRFTGSNTDVAIDDPEASIRVIGERVAPALT